MPYQPKYSNILKEEIKRLEKGNLDEKKRAKKIFERVSEVILNPSNVLYQKTLPDNYSAVDIYERFRLFFKIFPKYNVVYFAWINDESYLHRQGDVHDCYAEFARLYGNGGIPPYVHELILKDKFSKSSSWGAQLIYIEFSRLTDQNHDSARSHLLLSQSNEKQYQLRSISVTEEDKGLASKLLGFLVTDAETEGIELYYDLILIGGALDKSRHLLKKFNFQLEFAEVDVEVWIRVPSKFKA